MELPIRATGITTDVVESMEKALRRDVQREIQVNDHKILLHDEVEDGPGRFTITAQWENVDVLDAMTPREVFNMMVEEGYKVSWLTLKAGAGCLMTIPYFEIKVDYTRVAIVSEIPKATLIRNCFADRILPRPQTDEQAPLPAALGQLVQRVKLALQDGDVIIQNCQMGRGRTTTGMVVSCLIATILSYDVARWPGPTTGEEEGEEEGLDGLVLGREDHSEEQAYMLGEYKTILQLVGVLSYGKVAKRLTDMAIDQMDGVQNLRKAVFELSARLGRLIWIARCADTEVYFSAAISYKIKVDACEPGSAKQKKLLDLGVNYLCVMSFEAGAKTCDGRDLISFFRFRYGTLIVLANYLIERREGETKEDDFAVWLTAHREITTLLGRRNLD